MGGHAGSDMLPPPPRRRTLAAMSVPAENERARNWEERKQQSNWAQGRPTHGSETSPYRTHNNTQGNHEVRALPQPPNAAQAERAISKHPPPLPLQGAHVLHKGRNCALRAGRCPPRGWQQGLDQPTAHGTVHVVRRCETLVPGGAGGWDRRGCATGAPRSANRQGEEQHRQTERGSHTRRDKGEHSKQGGGVQQGRRGNHAPPPPCVTFRLVVAPLRGLGQSPVLPLACCVGLLLSVGRCGRCSCWCRFRVRGAQ